MLSMGPGDYATLGGSVLPLDKTSSHSQQVMAFFGKNLKSLKMVS